MFKARQRRVMLDGRVTRVVEKMLGMNFLIPDGEGGTSL